jgi:class 3 adenylate cyclase
MRRAIWTEMRQMRLQKRSDREILRRMHHAPLNIPEGSDRTSAVPVSAPAIRFAAEHAEASSIDGERKTVSALFADIKGSTELEQDLDPVEARAIIDPALKLTIEAVHRYDGYVIQSTGDGIFALFGAPMAHEDHPQRVLHAARRMQEDLKRYAPASCASGASRQYRFG